MAAKTLKKGYTTGTCAQAATRAALAYLFTGREQKETTLTLPGGMRATFPIAESQAEFADPGDILPSQVTCVVVKDAGDDPDVTDGARVTVTVAPKDEPGVSFLAGAGIGHVTKPGLDQPVGAAAINRVPREMMEQEVKEACEETGYVGGMTVTVSIPGGAKLAEKTFNPRLGIEGGLSILGTTGIVEPRSEQAILDTIRVEIRMHVAQGHSVLVAAPGNYGLDFLDRHYGIRAEEVVTISNYIGPALDMAREEGCAGLLLVGHIGKLVKVAGGIMNTHSQWADCRMELLASAALRAGLGSERAQEILMSISTDDALSHCTEAERGELMTALMAQMEAHLSRRAEGDLAVEAATFSNVYGLLGETSGFAALCAQAKKEQEA